MKLQELLSKVFYGVAIGLLLCLSSFIVPAQGQIKLKYANYPPAPTFPCVQMERWKTEVEKRTNGKVKVDTFPGGTLLTVKNMFDGIVAGVADIGCENLSGRPGAFPLVEAVSLPIGWPSATVASVSLLDLVDKYKPKEFEKVMVLTMFTSPPANIMSMKPVRSLSDLKGYELRAAGVGAKTLELLGGTPIAMPHAEVPEALQRGIIKGNVSSLETLKDFKHAEQCRHATANISLYVSTFAVMMNKSKWDSLPEDVKKVFNDLSKEHSIWTGQYVDNHTEEAIKWAKETYNIQIYNLSKDELSKWYALLRPMIDNYQKEAEAKGLAGKSILDDIMKLKEKYTKEYAK